MRKIVFRISKRYYTQQELGFTCIKPIKGELFGQFRCRDIWVSNYGRVVSTDFQGRGYVRELIPIDDGHGLTIVVRRKHFNPNGERLNNMVAEVFLENPGDCKRVRYLDGNYHNCRVDNLYYYFGRKEEAGRKFPNADIFGYDEWFPFKIREMDVKASGIIATTKKAIWDKGERLRRLETMQILEAERTESGYVAKVVAGGSAVSTLEMKDGRFVLMASWGSCITVRRVNQPIVEASDLKLVLESIKEVCRDLIENETPMELADMHIENLAFSKGVLDDSETAIPMAA